MPGALEFLHEVERSGKSYPFFTNNASKSPELYIKKLAGMDCPIERSRIMASGGVIIHRKAVPTSAVRRTNAGEEEPPQPPSSLSLPIKPSISRSPLRTAYPFPASSAPGCPPRPQRTAAYPPTSCLPDLQALSSSQPSPSFPPSPRANNWP